MQWCVFPPGEVNHAPEVAIDGSLNPAVRRVRLSRGQALTFRWWVYEEAGTLTPPLPVEAKGPRALVRGPALEGDGPAGTAHLVLEVTDGGAPALTAYRRVILELVR